MPPDEAHWVDRVERACATLEALFPGVRLIQAVEADKPDKAIADRRRFLQSRLRHSAWLLMLVATLAGLLASKLDLHACSKPMEMWVIAASITSLIFAGYAQYYGTHRGAGDTILVQRGGDVEEYIFPMVGVSLFCLALPFFYTRLANPLSALACLFGVY